MKKSSSSPEVPATLLKLTPYAEDNLEALAHGARLVAATPDLDLALPQMALLVAAALKLKFQAALMRLFRLLKNERFEPEALLHRRLMQLQKQGRLRGGEFIVDWTSCGLFEVLYGAVALEQDDQHCGRAMLLYAEAFAKGTLRTRKNNLEKAFLGRIKEAFAACADALQEPDLFKTVVFLLDRGFSKDDMLSFLYREQFRFVVRAKLKVCCLSPKGRRVRLDKYAQRLSSGQIVKGLLYKCDAPGQRPRVNLVVHKQRVGGMWASWYLFTNLPDANQAAQAYGHRFAIEESFKDAKTHWKIEQRRFAYEDRFTRYLGLLSLIQAELCQTMLVLLGELEDLAARLGQSGRNKLSLPNLLRRAQILLPEEIQALGRHPLSLYLSG
jgi:hypothetical protein